MHQLLLVHFLFFFLSFSFFLNLTFIIHLLFSIMTFFIHTFTLLHLLLVVLLRLHLMKLVLLLLRELLWVVVLVLVGVLLLWDIWLWLVLVLLMRWRSLSIVISVLIRWLLLLLHIVVAHLIVLCFLRSWSSFSSTNSASGLWSWFLLVSHANSNVSLTTSSWDLISFVISVNVSTAIIWGCPFSTWVSHNLSAKSSSSLIASRAVHHVCLTCSTSSFVEHALPPLDLLFLESKLFFFELCLFPIFICNFGKNPSVSFGTLIFVFFKPFLVFIYLDLDYFFSLFD